MVVYDEYAEVWVISQFALNLNAPQFAECIAVSETSDPTGAWYAYQFDYPNANVLNDYPKFGVWPAANNSAYFASFNQFRCSSARVRLRVAGRRGDRLRARRDDRGRSRRQIYVNLFGVDPNLGRAAAVGRRRLDAARGERPEHFLQFDADEWGYPDDQLEVWEFTVDWDTPANPTFDSRRPLPTANFNPWICGSGQAPSASRRRARRTRSTR